MRAWSLVLALGICTVGCAKAPFTTSVLDSYGLAPTDLASLQFFTSEKIVLEREVIRQARAQHGGELHLQDDTHTEVVQVSEHLPCVVLRVEGEYLLLGFSPKHLDASLWFRAEPLEEVAGDDRRYVLTALDNPFDERTEPFAPRFSKGFLVSWAGQKYRVVSGRTAHLLYQIPDDERRTVEVSPPGWKLSDRAARPPVVAPPPTNDPEPEEAP